MKAIRTRQFKLALYTSFATSALFLVWFVAFGLKLAQTNFRGIADCVFAVLILAALSFIVFCFVPYFRADRRWYSISALFTAVFLVGAAMLWQVPVSVVGV